MPRAKNAPALDYKQWQFYLHRETHFPSPASLSVLERKQLIFFILIENYLLNNNATISTTDISQALATFGLTGPMSSNYRKDIVSLKDLGIATNIKSKGYHLTHNFIWQLADALEKNKKNALAFTQTFKKAAELYPYSHLKERIESYPIFNQLKDQPAHAYPSEEENGEQAHLSPTEIEDILFQLEQNDNTTNHSYMMKTLSEGMKFQYGVDHDKEVDFSAWEIFKPTNKSIFSLSMFHALSGILLENAYRRTNEGLNRKRILEALHLLSILDRSTPQSLKAHKVFVYLKQINIMQSKHGKKTGGYTLHDHLLGSLSELKNASKTNYFIFLGLIQKMIQLYPDHDLSKFFNSEIFSQEFQLELINAECSPVIPGLRKKTKDISENNHSPVEFDLINDEFIPIPDGLEFSLDEIIPSETTDTTPKTPYCSSRLFPLPPPAKRQKLDSPIDLTEAETQNSIFQKQPLNFSTWQCHLHQAELNGNLSMIIFVMFTEAFHNHGNQPLSFYDISRNCLQLSGGKLSVPQVYLYLEKLVTTSILQMSISENDAYYSINGDEYFQHIRNFPSETLVNQDLTSLYYTFHQWIKAEPEPQVGRLLLSKS